jgi:hypothetical protein
MGEVSMFSGKHSNHESGIIWRDVILPSSSHLSPTNPIGQVHSYAYIDPLIFLQEPPLKHGALAHGVPTLIY